MNHAVRSLAVVLSLSGFAVLSGACGTNNDGGGGGNADAAPSADGGGTTPADSGNITLGDATSGNDSTVDTDSALPESDSATADTSTDDGGVDSAIPFDANGPDSTGPDGGFLMAAHPRFPLVSNNGVPVVMAKPVFYAVTFGSTYANNVTDLDTFVKDLGTLPYWAATTSEYGVAKPTVKKAIHLTEAAPQTIADAGIKTWLTAKLNAGGAFGTPSANTLYILFYPNTTSITQGSGASCSAFGGYHGSTTATVGGNSILVPYAVVPECLAPADAGAALTLQGVTDAASHEMVEAVTDPYVDQGGTPNYGYAGTDSAYAAWAAGIVGSPGAGLELGDMCESFGSSFFTPTGFPYDVQRTWSNKNVMAGIDPCAPYNTKETYYFAAQPIFDPDFLVNEAKNPPVYLPTVNITDSSATPPTFATQGVKIAVGASATIPVILFSDGPQPTWTFLAADLPLSATPPPTPNLTFSWDRTSGVNGDVAHLTIHVVAADPTVGGNVFRITSTDGVLNHTVYGYVGQN